MYSFLHQILSDKKGGAVFSCFGAWHLFYIILTVAVAIISLLYLRGKTKNAVNRLSRIFINFAFGIYLAGFFLMPIAYGEIDIEKLPFHVCTAMCVACFLSNHNSLFAKFRLQLAMLGFISNLIYLIYPAGVMWHGVHPLSYRVIETLLFHSAMTVYGLLVMISEHDGFKWRRCYKNLSVTVCMTLWAMLGNLIYNGELGDYSHFFNWFFVVRDPFYVLPANIAPYIMPIFNVVAFFGLEMLVHLIMCKSQKQD